MTNCNWNQGMQSEKMRMFVENSDLKIGGERKFVLSMKLS